MGKAGAQGADAPAKGAEDTQQAAAEEQPQETEQAGGNAAEGEQQQQQPEQAQSKDEPKDQKAGDSSGAGASNQLSPQLAPRSPSGSPGDQVVPRRKSGSSSCTAPDRLQQQQQQQPAAEPALLQPAASSAGKASAEAEEGSQVDKILEEGRIYFLYRPKVAVKAAKSVAQLQRFFLVLQPQGRAAKRLIIIGKKRLPSAARRERYFGFVAGVEDRVEALLSDLGPKSYQTATQGERHLEGARVAGEGHYALLAKHNSGTFLAWTLELPSEPGPVQKDLRIGKQGSLALSIKNPRRDDARIGLEQKADFGDKQSQFKSYAWIAARDPALLDVKNAELLFIGAGTDLEGEFGAAFGSHMAEKAAEDAAAAAAGGGSGDEAEEAGDEEMVDALKQELKTEQLELEAAPAAEKQWV